MEGWLPCDLRHLEGHLLRGRRGHAKLSSGGARRSSRVVRRRAFLICHAAAWAMLGCAFVVVSVPHVWATVRNYSLGPVQPYHTTDAYMASLLHVPNGSARLERAFSTLPLNEPVAVLLPDESPEGLFIGYLVSYFAWPREVHSVALTRASAATQMRALHREALGAMFFCGVDPPAGLKPAIRLGSQLVMVPTTNPEAAAP